MCFSFLLGCQPLGTNTAQPIPPEQQTNGKSSAAREEDHRQPLEKSRTTLGIPGMSVELEGASPDSKQRSTGEAQPGGVTSTNRTQEESRADEESIGLQGHSLLAQSAGFVLGEHLLSTNPEKARTHLEHVVSMGHDAALVRNAQALLASPKKGDRGKKGT